ncbi:MAG: hypothetical protein KC656_30525, partial [Myxococcales bacterium]|nr:hypothetical protein [Myxococcales bacterium]
FADVLAGTGAGVRLWRGTQGPGGREDDEVVLTAAGDDRRAGAAGCVVPGWVLVGDPGWEDGRGAVFALRDATVAGVGEAVLDDLADAVWTGDHVGDAFGTWLVCAEVDGAFEVLVGAPGWDVDGATGDHGALVRLPIP